MSRSYVAERYSISSQPTAEHYLNVPRNYMDSAVHAWIEINGQPARVLDKAHQRSDSASCFVEARESQSFQVVFADRRTAGPKQSYALEVLVDGNRVGSKVVENHNPLFFSNQNSQDRIFSFSSNQQTKVPLAFASCDDSYGTVAIKYHRVKIIEGDTKEKGRRVSSTSSSEYIDMVDQPYLYFEFRYASRAYLDGLKRSSTSPRSAVSRNPAPPASSSSSTPSSVSSSRQRAPLSRLPLKRPQQVTTASPTPRLQARTEESTSQRLSTPAPRESADYEERKPSMDKQNLASDILVSLATTPYSSSPSPAVRVDPESEEGGSDDECETLKRKIASLKRQEEIAALEDEVREKEKRKRLRLQTGEEQGIRKKIKLELED